MSNALVAATANNVAAYGHTDPYAAAAREMGGGNGGAKYIQYNGKTGRYSVKKDELPQNIRLVFNPDATERGAICWVDGKAVEELMVNILSGPAPTAKGLEETNPHGPYRTAGPGEQQDGWIDQASIRLANAESGEEFILKLTSESGRRAVGGVLGLFSKMSPAHPGHMPIIELGARGFTPQNARYTVYAPEFKIVGWIDPGAMAAAYAGAEGANEVETERYEAEPQAAAPAPVATRAAPPPQVAHRPAPPAAAGPRPRSF